MQAVDVAGNLERVLACIGAAARRCGRDPREVALVAVSKTKPAALIDAAIAAGAHIVGENYVQEAREKRPHVRGAAEWHFIGHLQRNKARSALEIFDVVETLDSLDLAAALDRLAGERDRDVRVLIEANSGGETSKRGIAPEALPAFIESLARFPRLRVEGLMTIPPPAEGDAARAPFRLLRRLRDELRGQTPANVDLRELSMGMTGDYEIAIEEGSTIVRVGTAIFGARG